MFLWWCGGVGKSIEIFFVVKTSLCPMTTFLFTNENNVCGRKKTRGTREEEGGRRRRVIVRETARVLKRESASPASLSLFLSRSLAAIPPSIDPLPVPPGPRPLHRVGLGRDEREVAEVQAREEVDDGAPGALEEVKNHFFLVFRLETKKISFFFGRLARSFLWASGSGACESSRMERDACAAGPK